MKKNSLSFISLLLFFICVTNLFFSCLPVQGEAISLPDSSAPVTSFLDIAGHWSEKEIAAWTTHGLAGGYPDGTFRPDSPITRAEFVTLVNRAFGYTKIAEQIATTVDGHATGSMTFQDVAATDWFAGEFANASAVGSLGGYPDGTVMCAILPGLLMQNGF